MIEQLRFYMDVQNLIFEWSDQHKEELRQNWLLARDHKALTTIDPLE